MIMIANILMVGGTFAIAVYCMVLSQRLKRLSALESGMGNAVALLSAQVDDMTTAIGKAQQLTVSSSNNLDERVKRAEEAVAKLELLLASLHDLPAQQEKSKVSNIHEARPHLQKQRPSYTVKRVNE